MLARSPTARRQSSWLLTALAAALLSGALPSPAGAGGGPENVLLVVNSRSWASLTVANHYARLRDVPAANVVHLDWDGNIERVNLTTFRDRILRPVLSALESRKLADHVDYVVYSSDFPWAVDAVAELRSVNLPAQLNPVGSLNGCTFFYQHILGGSPNFLLLGANRYFIQPVPAAPPASRGFRSWYGWDPAGRLLEAGGERYLLSTMLAVTSGRGNSVDQAVDYLSRAAAADGTRPDGTIYFCKTNDVRSTTRDTAFTATIDHLRQLGVAARMVYGTLPPNVSDVQGVMVGAAAFSWPDSRSTILPGAICEHLTSHGGDLRNEASQTPLSHWLAHGAAGSSGAVVEPFAIQAKFPVPAIHVHYAHGCSLAEAFYQSVAGPYQLLVVGDPLCQPWARPPRVSVPGIAPGATLSGTVELRPESQTDGDQVDRFQLFVDGASIGVCPAGGTLSLDTARLPDGYHELRVVAVAAGAIETQGRLILPVSTANHGGTIEVSLQPAGTVRWDQSLTVSVNAPDALAVVIQQDSRRVGMIQGAQGRLTISPRELGSGPVALKAVALGARGLLSGAVSPPLSLVVEPEPARRPPAEPPATLLPGLLLERADGSSAAVADTASTAWLDVARVKPGQAYTLRGWFHVPEDAVYQLHLRHGGPLALDLSGQTVYSADDGKFERRYLPLHMAAGQHELVVRATAVDPPQLEIALGRQGVQPLSRDRFGHRPPADSNPAR